MSQHSTLNLKDIIQTNTIITLIFFGLMFPMNAMAMDTYGADVVDYGIYETDFIKFETAPDTDLGKIEMVSEMQLLSQTELIPGQMGTEFGIRYIVNGDQDGKEVDILVRVLHSLKVNKKDVSKVNEWVTTKKIGRTSYDGWEFKSDSELIHGNWTIQLYHQGLKLAEKRFYVY
jgi:hypothetical protein